MDSRNWFSAVPLGLLQRVDDDVLAGIGICSHIPCVSKPGLPGSAALSNTMASDTLVRLRPYLCTNIRRRGLISAASTISMRIIFRTRAIATDVHRRFCLELSKQFPDYSDDLWGITASDSQKGYVIWGGPPSTGPIDGTVVPSASAGSLPFLPQPVMRVLQNIKNHYGGAWSRYGFVNAFNPLKNWYDTDVIGIDTGITMLMAENARTGFVWETFMKNQEAKRGWSARGSNLTNPESPTTLLQFDHRQALRGNSNRQFAMF